MKRGCEVQCVLAGSARGLGFTLYHAHQVVASTQ
jgi:hypothetical protein